MVGLRITTILQSRRAPAATRLGRPLPPSCASSIGGLNDRYSSCLATRDSSPCSSLHAVCCFSSPFRFMRSVVLIVLIPSLDSSPQVTIRVDYLSHVSFGQHAIRKSAYVSRSISVTRFPVTRRNNFSNVLERSIVDPFNMLMAW